MNFSLLDNIQSGAFDGALSALYISHNLSEARTRAIHAAESFRSAFSPSASAMLYSGPGRTEIGGNHTDHQHGHVLCGSVDMDTCVWNPVTIALISNEALRNTIQSIVTTVVTGGVAMVVIFAVDNKIFAPDFGKK